MSEDRRYRVIVRIPETEDYEEQELVDYLVHDDEQVARAYMNSMSLDKYPPGTETFLEYRPHSPWRRL